MLLQLLGVGLSTMRMATLYNIDLKHRVHHKVACVFRAEVLSTSIMTL